MTLRTIRFRLFRFATLATFGASIGFSASVLAQTLTFPSNPLFTAQPVEPNFLISIDNSGSTDWEVSFNSNGGEAWWNPGNTITGCTTVGFAGCGTSAGSDTAQSGVLNFNTSSSTGMYDYDYLFPIGGHSSSNLGGRYYTDDGNGGTSGFYAIPPLPSFAWARMSTFTYNGVSYNYNGMYFDPTQTYTPWPSNGSTSYSNATPTAVSTENSTTSATVTSSNTIYLDLTQDIASDIQVAAGSATACTSITEAGVSQWGFRVYSGMVLPAGTCYKNSTASGAWTSLSSSVTISSTSTPASGNTIWIRYFPATFYLPHNYQVTLSDGTTQAFNTWYGYTATPLTGYAPDGTTVLDGYEIKPANFSGGSTGTAYTTAIQNFANWFQYYRKRYLAIRGGMGAAFNNVSGMRVGFFTIDNSSGSAWSTSNGGNLTMLDLSSSSNRTSFFDSAYGYARGNFGTPNREAVNFMGQQFRRTDSGAPIISACQKNFEMLFTDGYSNSINGDYTATAGTSGDGQTSGTNAKYITSSGSQSTGVPYYDNVDYTMADRAMYDYIGPLLSGTVNGVAMTAGKVAVDPSCTASSGSYVIPYSAVDCNNNLHSVFYGVILNSDGFVYGINSNATSDPYGNPPSTSASYPPASGSTTWNWPTNSAMQSNYTPAAVDDMWHATVNSRGLMFNAHNTTEITNAFSSILNDIIARTSSAAALAVNSSQLSVNTQLYQALYNPTDWSGELIDLPLSTGTATSGSCVGVAAGNTCTQQWEAGSMLTKYVKSNGATARGIITYNADTKAGAAFRWNTIGATNQRLLETSTEASASNTANAQLRLNWVRGDQTQESSTASPQFRKRPNSLLGDIIDSNPYYEGTPSETYSFNSYATFRQTNYNRTAMVYVGANDGMLHAFRASDGQEQFAFIPSKSFGTTSNEPLVSLTNTSYTHIYTVDGSPTVDDAYLSDANWHTMLAGTLGYGGKEVFALDVTNPSNFTTSSTSSNAETNASSIVKWEFTDSDDSDLGYTFSETTIAKTHNSGKFAVFVGNGYNSTGGSACLFILYLDHTSTNSWSSDYKKMCAPSDGVTGTNAPNGLSSPAVVDLDGDGVMDRVYAGDLHGNVWRFDISNSSSSNWTVTKLFAGTNGTSTNGQPVTDRPEVGKNTRTTGYIVYFGTGRYLDATDNTVSNQTTQAFYALYDKDGTSTVASNTLVQQTITGSTTTTDSNGNAVTYYTTSNNTVATTTGGWYLTLHNSGSILGERVVQDSGLLEGDIIFNTLVPSQDSCSYGGSSTLYILDAQTGTPPTKPLFDVNGNGKIDSGDTVNGSNPTGLSNPSLGITSAAAFIGDMSGGGTGTGDNSAFACQSSASGTPICHNIPLNIPTGRISWREFISGQ